MNPAKYEIQKSVRVCAPIAEGPFTPVFFEWFEYITGEKGWRLSRRSETADGRFCIVHT